MSGLDELTLNPTVSVGDGSGFTEGQVKDIVGDTAAAGANIEVDYSGGVLTVAAPDVAPLDGSDHIARAYRPDLDCFNVKDYGAVGNGVADDTAAIQAAITAACGGAPSGTPAAARAALGPVYLPSGVYRVTGILDVTSVLNFEMRGDALGGAVISVAGTGTRAAALRINGSYHGKFTDLTFVNAGGSTVVLDDVVALDWLTATSARSSTGNRFERLIFRDIRWANAALAAGRYSAGAQVDDTTYQSITINGTWTAGNTTTHQRGFAVGDGTHGNVLNHFFFGCSVVACRYNWYFDAVNGGVFGFDTGSAEADFVHSGVFPLTIEAGRSEQSQRLLIEPAGGSAASVMAIRDVLVATGSLHADGYFIKIAQPGTVDLVGLHVEATAANPKIQAAVSSGFPLSVNVRGCVARQPVTSLVAGNTDVHTTIVGYVEVNSSGQPVASQGFMTLQGPIVTVDMPGSGVTPGFLSLKEPNGGGYGAGLSLGSGAANTATLQLDVTGSVVLRNGSTGGGTYIDSAAGGLHMRNHLSTEVAAVDDSGNVSFPAANGTVTLGAGKQLVLGSTAISAGTGSPEGAVTGPVGSLRLRTDGGAGTTLYRKETGTGNTGWVAAKTTLTSADLSDFTEAAQDATAAMLTAGTNVTLSYNDAANTLTINAAAAPSTPEIVNVKSAPYNATGDGTTDDTTAIQAALTAAAAVANGAVVYFPAGTYIVSNWLVYDSKVSLVGAAVGTVTIKNTTTRVSSTLMLRPNGTDVHDVTVQNITWDQRGDIYDAGGDSTSEPLMDCSNTVNMVVADCGFRNVRTVGVYGDGTAAHPIVGIRVLRNHVYQAGGDGISFFGSLINFEIAGNTVEHTEDDAIAVQDHVSTADYPSNGRIVDNTVLDCDAQTSYGSTPNGIYVFGGDRVLVARNHVKNVFASCIKVGIGSGRRSTDVTVRDNRIGGAGTNNSTSGGGRVPAHGIMLNGVDGITIGNTTILSAQRDYNFSFFDYTANTGLRVERDGGTQSVTYAASITPNPLAGETIKVTLTGNVTFVAPDVAVAKPGGRMTLQVTQDGTGGRTVTLSGAWKGAWIPDTTASAVSASEWEFDGTNWVQVSVQPKRLDQLAAPTTAISAGSQRITSLADATSATDALNRQSGDARFEPIIDRTLNTQTADYTLVAGDSVKTVVANKTTAIAFTVPPNSSVAFAVGTRIPMRNIGVGQLTVTPGAAVTVNGIATVQQFTEVAIVKTATDTWQVVRTGLALADLAETFHFLTTGQETIPGARGLNSSNTVSMTSGSSRLTYFTPHKPGAYTQIKLFSGATVSSGLTIARAAIHTVAANGDTTVIASTTNDTALFGTTNTAYTKALSATVNLVRGVRYVFELLELGTPGQKPGISAFSGVGGSGTLASHMIDEPRTAALINGQTDIGTGYTAAAIAAATNAGATSSMVYAVLLA